MSKLFRTPLRTRRSPVRADTPEKDRKPAMYFAFTSLVPVGVDVWVTTGNVVTETQPAQWESVKTWYGGGRDNIISDAEAAFLIAANPEYAGYITDITGPVVPPVLGGSGYGVGPFGQSGYGT